MLARRGFWLELWDPQRAACEKMRIAELDVDINRRLRTAMARGRAGKTASRSQAGLGNLYISDTALIF